ncbi:hypothetical protein [Thiolapillus sp.]
MAKSGRFPLLYWTSIGLLVLMLAFTGWLVVVPQHYRLLRQPSG